MGERAQTLRAAIKKLSRSKVKVKCYRNLITSVVHHTHIHDKSYRFQITSFSMFARRDGRTDRQTDRHTHMRKDAIKNNTCFAGMAGAQIQFSANLVFFLPDQTPS